MPDDFVYLREFKESELVFDADETREILKFFFPTLTQQIQSVGVTNQIRNFAQALLIEAIDKTYALGYVEVLFKAIRNPGAGMKKILSKIGYKSAAHWFKHATRHDLLLSAKISSRVRDAISWKFKSDAYLLLSGVASNKRLNTTRVAFVTYGEPSSVDVLWG